MEIRVKYCKKNGGEELPKEFQCGCCKVESDGCQYLEDEWVPKKEDICPEWGTFEQTNYGDSPECCPKKRKDIVGTCACEFIDLMGCGDHWECNGNYNPL
jgi:hypothetical protein